MILGVVFRTVQIDGFSPIIPFLFLISLAIFYGVWAVSTLREEKKSKEKLKLWQEWRKNGIAMSKWIEDHYEELYTAPESTIARPELQAMLWKDFDIYGRLVVLDPSIKDDPVFREGREFYASLINVKGDRPS